MEDTLYDEPAYYRMLFRERTRDIAFYADQCRQTGPVLELGAGEGRVSFALAAQGHRVVAVEREPTMLAGLEARRSELPAAVAGRVRAVLGDAGAVRLDERFERVILPFNGLAHVHTDKQLDALLETTRAHLAPGGRFVFDTVVPDPEARDGSSAVPRLVHPRTGAVCRLEEHHAWHGDVQTIRTELIERESGARQTLTLRLRRWPETDVRAALSSRGWVISGTEDLGDAIGFVAAREHPDARPGR